MSYDAAALARKILTLAPELSAVTVHAACEQLQLSSNAVDLLNERECSEQMTEAQQTMVEHSRGHFRTKASSWAKLLAPAVVRVEWQRDPRGSSLLIFLSDRSFNSADGESWRFDR